MSALGLALALSTTGCWSYRPLRWPPRELWAAPPRLTRPIQLPNVLPADASRVEQDGVSVTVAVLDPERTKDAFHADLLRGGIQPLWIEIRNRSDQAYAFRKAAVDSRHIPARRAARAAYIHPVITAVRVVKWMVFFVPGLLVESIVEPTLVFDFPGMEEAARRPAMPDHRGIKADFERREIADIEIGPNQSNAGLLFVRPLSIGRAIPVTMINARTGQPMVVEVPTPPPVHRVARAYPQGYATVWGAAVETARRIRGWRVASVEPTSGTITVKSGARFLAWTTAVRTTITLARIDDTRTQMTVENTLLGSTSRAYGTRSRGLTQFLKAMDIRFPEKKKRSVTRRSSAAPLQNPEP